MDSDSETDFSDSESISEVSFVSDWSIDNDFEISADDEEEDGPNKIYNSEGVDDQTRCCRWSINNDEWLQNSILPFDGIPEYGKPAVDLTLELDPMTSLETLLTTALS